MQLLIALAIVVAGLALSSLDAPVRAAQTFDVNSTADPGAGGCDITECTLREAISAANADAVKDTITFSVGNGVQTIALQTFLPVILQPVIIDGTTQEGFSGTPLIALDGSAVTTTGAQGLFVSAGNSEIRSLVVVDFPGDGVLFYDKDGNELTGSYVGVRPDGSTAAGNAGAGVAISGSNQNKVGGSGAGEGNVIGGNGEAEVEVDGGTANQISGNRIGVNAAVGGGRLRVHSGASDTLIGGTDGVTVGGPCTGACNVIGGGGILIEDEGSDDTIIRGNYIGLSADGASDLSTGPGFTVGVYVADFAEGTMIGGTSAAARNVISGNSYGIRIDARDTTVQGNFIGTDVSGTIDLGGENGIVVVTVFPNTLIGGETAGAGNLLGGNDTGILALDSGADLRIVGNLVGRQPGGLGVANGVGIRVSVPVKIGSTDPAFGNLIANNTGDGIIIAGAALGAEVLANSIFRNGGHGIDISNDGTTENDPLDADAGGNDSQNFPAITGAIGGIGQTTIDGTLNSEANQEYVIRLYANMACDSPGNGEGERYLGEVTTATTNVSGNVTWQANIPVEVVAGQWLTGTATDENGNTSEFSDCFRVLPVPDCDSQPATIVGFAGADYIEGTAGADVILGSSGADVIDGMGGNDTLCGQKGGDTLIGGLGLDTLVGATGDDLLQGGADNDTLVGGPAVDVLEGGGGDDDLEGNDQADELDGNSGDDSLKGGKGNDALDGGPNNDTCNGNTGAGDTGQNCETLLNIP